MHCSVYSNGDLQTDAWERHEPMRTRPHLPSLLRLTRRGYITTLFSFSTPSSGLEPYLTDGWEAYGDLVPQRFPPSDGVLQRFALHTSFHSVSFYRLCSTIFRSTGFILHGFFYKGIMQIHKMETNREKAFLWHRVEYLVPGAFHITIFSKNTKQNQRRTSDSIDAIRKIAACWVCKNFTWFTVIISRTRKQQVQ